ncbi:MAG TPA: N-acetylglucosamine-6-phosphate deacetylase [Bacteroidales bacterium]|nr:N-acetylglucosamine-6-phosphate deacetylase [Bacteroidales bacterium]
MLSALSNAIFFTGTEVLREKALLFEDDLITGFTDINAIPHVALITDCEGRYVSPGFIDLQIAGSGGFLFSSFPEPHALHEITRSIVESGTTGFLLVLPTNTFDVYRKAARTILENPHPSVLGLHLEGPYISQAKRGAHVSKLIRKPETSELITLLREGEGIIKMMTVAPEECNPEFISILLDHGVVPCAGHSNATMESAESGFAWGIKGVTHLFNAMSSFHHREPGLPGASFLSPDAMASIVADGIHVSYDTIKVAKRIMGNRLYLISDAVEENNTGEYHHIRQADRFVIPDGTLSGSALTMMKAVENCVKHAGIDLDESLRMASLYPAGLMNINTSGKLEKGYNADFIIFDKSFKIRNIFLRGIEIR